MLFLFEITSVLSDYDINLTGALDDLEYSTNFKSGYSAKFQGRSWLLLLSVRLLYQVCPSRRLSHPIPSLQLSSYPSNSLFTFHYRLITHQCPHLERDQNAQPRVTLMTSTTSPLNAPEQRKLASLVHSFLELNIMMCGTSWLSWCRHPGSKTLSKGNCV